MASQTSSLDSARGQRPALSIGSHISVEREKGLITGLTVLFAVMTVVAAATAVEAFVAWRRWDGYQLFAVFCFSPFAVIASVVSLLGGLRSRQDLADKDHLVSKVKGIVGEDVMLFGLYLTLVAAVGMGVLGGCCVFYQEEIDMVLQAQFADPNTASVLYHGASLDQASSSLHSSYLMTGYLCFLYLLFSLLCFLIQLSLSLDHETTHSILQVESLVQLCLALFIILTATFCLHIKTDFDWEDVPKTGLEVSRWLGIIAGALAVYGFYVGKWEDQTHIVCHGLMGAVYLLAAVYYLTMQMQTNEGLRHSLTEGCLDTMSLIESRYMQALGCPNKYLQPATQLQSLTCPKAQQRLIWEETPEKTVYGCLNMDCCGYLVATTQVVVDYLDVSMLFAGAMVAIVLITSIALLTKISQKGRSMFHSADSKILFAMLLILALGCGLIYAIIPLSPRPKPDISPAVTVTNAGLLDAWELQDSLCIRTPLLTIQPYMFHSNNTDKTSLEVSFKATGGYLGLNKEPQGVNITEKTGNFMVIEGNDGISLTNVLQSAVFCLFCPFSQSVLSINISRNDYFPPSSQKYPSIL